MNSSGIKLQWSGAISPGWGDCTRLYVGACRARPHRLRHSMSPTTQAAIGRFIRRGKTDLCVSPLTHWSRPYHRRYQLSFFKISAKDTKNKVDFGHTNMCYTSIETVKCLLFFVYTHDYNKTLWFWKKRRKLTVHSLSSPSPRTAFRNTSLK